MIAEAPTRALTLTGPRQMSAVDYPEQGREPEARESDDDLPRLIQMYEASEEAGATAREKSERDRDYVDNKQLTDDEVAKLRKRGQPPITLNVIRSRAAFLGGMEKKQRRDPKAYPRNNPNDVHAAEAFTDGLRYAVEAADYASKRSQAWKNITVEGFGGVEIAAVQKRDSYEFTISRIPWDRLFYDPHSSEPDFSDARYVGQVMWMDYDAALDRAVKAGQIDEARAKEILDTTMSSAAGIGRTYDDKPKWQVWAQKSPNKRVRVVMIWHKEVDGWKYCEFTQSGKLSYSNGFYVDQDGESYCPWLLESANVDRDNNRFGEVRHLIDPQDEINKRRSKALHLLNTSGVIADSGAVKDINAARREMARPDFYIEMDQPGARFEIIKGTDLAAGQAQLGAQAMQYVLEAGPNAALLGKGPQDQSGRAIEAQQAGGLVEQSDLMDTLRRLDWRVFRVLASMMKQFWDGPKWIRVTDDDDAPKWVGLNEPMYEDTGTGETGPESQWSAFFEQGGNPEDPDQINRIRPAVDPETGEPVLNNDVSRLDMDIIVSDAPDTITLDGENYQAFIQLMSSGLPPPALKLAIEMHPGLPSKRKKLLTDMIDQMAAAPPPPGADDVQRLAKEKVEAEIAKIRSDTYKNLTAGEKAMFEVGGRMPLPDVGAGLTDEQPMPEGGPMGPEGPPMPPPGPQGGPPSPDMGMDGPMPPPSAPPPPGPPQGGPLVGMMTGV